jgi:hypothetical protein
MDDGPWAAFRAWIRTTGGSPDGADHRSRSIVPMNRRAILVVAAAALLVTACGGRGNAAPPTDIVRRPEVSGVITMWDYWDGAAGRYTLDTGEVVELNVGRREDRLLARLLSETDIYFPYGGEEHGEPIGRLSVLLLAGHDPDGSAWYAAAQQRDDDACPFGIRGAGVYDEGSALHFSTGLILPKDPSFALDLDYHDIEEFPLRSADTICVDRSGKAVSASIWLPY